MKFRLRNMQATVASINARKEGPDEDRVLAVDVKLQVLCDFDALNFFEKALIPCVFLDSGAVRNLQMGPIPFTHELESYRLEICGSTHFGAKVKKFTVEPRDTFKVLLCFQCSFKPSSDEMAQLAEYLQDDIELTLEPENEELDFSAPAEPEPRMKPAAAIPQPAQDLLGDESDPLYGQAVSITASTGRPSITFLQRHLQVGYNRAARLMDQMERDGYVTATASGGRELTQAGRELAA